MIEWALHATSVPLPCNTRTIDKIDFDGIPEETTWENVDVYQLTMHKPDSGELPIEKSGSLLLLIP
jgi:hypothetical protein